MKPPRMDYEWHLRKVMALNGIFATTDLVPLLAERGVKMSSTQVFRLVTQRPERLNLEVMAALCGILNCTPGDLLEAKEVAAKQARRKASGVASPPSGDVPRRPRAVGPEDLG